MKVGFFVWNPFQIYQFDSVVRQTPGARYLLQRRKTVDFDRLFPAEFLQTAGAPIKYLSREEMTRLDGEFDAIVCQTAFGHMESFEKTKVIGMQYSMSKERHQYGPWRVLCDLNLVYGQYSMDRLSPYGPCAMVGNPRFDRWFSNQFEKSKLDRIRARLDPRKKTVLYLPTWGQLSSMSDFGNAVAELSSDYNVIAKVHHKTDSHELSRKLSLSEGGIQDIFGASDDLLHLLHEADIVLSDYSGAIFDAINVGKPVVLLQRSPETLALIGAEKFGLESIEYARRDMIGPVVSAPELLASTVAAVIDGTLDFKESNRTLKTECFAFEHSCGSIAAEAIASAVINRAVRPNYQIYIRDMLREQRIAEEMAKAASLKQSSVSTARQSAKKIQPATQKTGVRKSKLRRWGGAAWQLALAPIHRLVEWRVNAIAQKNRHHNQPLEVTRSFEWLAMSLTARRLAALAARYDSPSTEETAVQLMRLACNKSKSVGLTPYINILAKYDRREELSKLVDDLLSRPLKDKARYLQRAARAQDFLGTRAEDISRARKDVFDFTMKTLPRSKNKLRNARLLTVMVVNRWLADAELLAGSVPLAESSRKNVEAAVQRSKRLLKEFHCLNEAANHNHLPHLAAADFVCYFNGEIRKVADTPATRFVEFFLPFYFFIEPETDAKARERICAMLRTTLEVLAESGAAIVPRHQFRLDNAAPSGHWPTVFSYHTTGKRDGWWHIKDAPLPGYFTIDTRGYSGWSSIGSWDDLPEEAKLANATDVERTWSGVQREFVASNNSKYAQNSEKFDAPRGRYLFLPMQVVGDSVARLAWIPTLALAQQLVELAPERGYSVVIKQHPKCTHAGVKSFIEKTRGRDKVYFTQASIHEVVPGASAVVTVNSGVGLEALLHGKVVISTGQSEYGVMTRKARNVEELAREIDSIENKLDIDRIKRFIHYYLSQCLVRGDDKEQIRHRLASTAMRVDRSSERATEAVV